MAMVKKHWLFLSLALTLYLLAAGLLFSHLITAFHLPVIDTMAVNRIVKETERQWDSKDFKKPEDCPYEYTVIGADGSVLFKSSSFVPDTELDAVRTHTAVLDISTEQKLLGKVFISTGYESSIQAGKKELAGLAALLILLPLLSVLLFTIFLNRVVLRPFRSLKDFARHIAMGNLDFPLPMDQNHIFGAFSESFDLMREQLKEARLKETAANKSKKELVASLSHDIKTPVASIKLTSELLLVTEKDAQVKAKLWTIYQKSEQIDRLITNMLQASLKDLGELTVTPVEISSKVLEAIIHDADYAGRLNAFSLPDCILCLDPFRMEQIVGNILNNAYKYAGTPITVRSDLTEDGLRLELMDYGKGVPEEELPMLFGKFYRGSSREKEADGSGLGLYISRCLTERMGGIIECANREDGFSVILYLPLMRPGL